MANILSKKFTEKAILYWSQHECGELCSHVESGEKGYVVFCETDSFGPLTRYVACKACYDESNTFVCCDCEEVKEDTLRVTWKRHDFDVREGDKPVVLCRPCTKLPKHQSRVSRNYEDLQRAYGPWDYDY